MRKPIKFPTKYTGHFPKFPPFEATIAQSLDIHISLAVRTHSKEY